MLESLSVASLGIIDRVELVLEPGFTVLTGETGAGKSLLVSSLELVAGQRASAELVRSGDERLQVQAVFSLAPDSGLAAVLAELGVSADDGLSIRREVSASGRSRCWLNDVAVSTGALQTVAPFLLSIHGQHEQHGLGDAATQRRLTDQFGGHHELVAATAAAFAAWREAADEAARLTAARERRRDRLDVIAYQLAEIDAVDPRDGEDQELAQRRLVLRNRVRLTELSAAALGRLADGEAPVLDHLARALRETEDMVACGLALEPAAVSLREALILVEDGVRALQGAADALDQDPSELDLLESRLHRLEGLMLKYGSPLATVVAHRAALAREREELADVAESMTRAAAAASTALVAVDRAARDLHAARLRAGDELAAAVVAVLARLGMAGTRLELVWTARPDPSSPLVRDGTAVAAAADGVEECELLFSANPGEELRPMARIASGGELSRLHLALRSALRRRRGGAPRTLLFDEVDSGLGGATAAALAALLADLAANDQVLAVSHLPQVAARAGGHFRISKEDQDGRVVTRVHGLDGAERVQEVARMVAGERVTAAALEHARELLAAP